MAIAEVGGQRATNNASSATTCDIGFPGNVTAGDLIIVLGACWNTSAVASITGSTVAGSTATVGSYTTIFGSTGIAWAGGTANAWIMYGIVTGTGSLTVRATSDKSGTYFNVACDEFSGVNSSPLDVNGGEATGGPGALSASDTITTTTANDLVIGAMAIDASVGTISAGSGYTLIAKDESGAVQPYAVEFQVFAGAAGSKTVDFSWTVTNNTWSMVNAAFKEPASGAQVEGAPSPPVTRIRLRQY